MDDRAAKTEAIFTHALGQPDPAQRSAYLAKACGGDDRLRARVDALLQAHQEAGGFMDSPENPDSGDGDTVGLKRPPRRDHETGLAEKSGAMIGHYKLLQRIGEGGFGVVWMADQEHPVRRRVALKIIKAGMDTKQVISRFEQERQALAMMDHPNIARVLDAGATETGRPYFVMELVRGVKITDYCDEQNLSTVDRIKLFVTVCQAVQHAHQKGIIHRDLKPSNILVTINDGEAVPKVIDFGVAKATHGRLTDGTLFTQFEQMIGTPLYMSPEQAEITSLDVDTRSDIYSLGVLLYELLTGRTPIDTATMAKAGMDEVRRLIREVDPPRPSTRVKTLVGNELTTVAKRRHAEPTKLPGTLRGDIDWIVMKCLEKDRKRRYDTANGLAMDLQRHLSNEVVVARPPTTAYLLSKLIRRNKIACIAGAAIAASLVIGILAAVWQAVRATHAESKAVATLDELRATAPAFAEQARALAAKEQFDQAIEKLDYAIKLRPDAPEYLVSKADLLQCQFKLAEAAATYRLALSVKPDHSRADASAKLCDELLAASPNANGKLTRESLARLHLAMLQQQRPAAELMPVARLLGEEKKLVVEYWLARLKDLAVSAERPLKDRLTVRDDGRLALDLSNTRIIDLSPLVGAPLATLDVSKSRELKDLSPLRGLELVELNLSETGVTDLAPLRDMRTLERLEMAGTKVADLSALGALRLKALVVRGCPVRDLKPLQKMPLEEINLRKTRVADLSPLVASPIRSIDLSDTPCVNFAPLAQLPLEKCYLEHCPIDDLSILRDKPLKELVLLGCRRARNYAALREIKTLELLLLDTFYRNLPAEDYHAIAALRDHPKLRQLGAGVYDPIEVTQTGLASVVAADYASTESTEVFWQEWDREQAYLPALRKSGIKFNLHRHRGGRDHLEIYQQPLSDLANLKDAPISMLTLVDCSFNDLTPIHDLKLKVLELKSNLVTDLSPLRGMPLETLSLVGSGFTDLSPLAGMPITSLYLEGCTNLTDVSALMQIPTLANATVPMKARNVDQLRKLPQLERIAFSKTKVNVDLYLPDTSATEFWKDYAWISRLNEAGVVAKTMQREADGTWKLDVSDTAFADLGLLRGAPISALLAQRTPVSDLAPLRGLPLKELWLNGAKVSDISPLAGMKLEALGINVTSVTDISPLRGMPLQKVWLPEQVTDVSPLAECRELTSIGLPQAAKEFDFLRKLPKLERISFTLDPQGFYPDKTAAEFWNEYGQSWAIALRKAGIAYTATPVSESAAVVPAAAVPAASKTKAKKPAAPKPATPTTPPPKPATPLTGLWKVTIQSKEFNDLSIFRGADNIRELYLYSTAVSDLEPLRGLQLTKLNLESTKVADLRPLAGMPLTDLNLRATGVSDLSVLRGMPLVVFEAGNTLVTDLAPLSEARLRTLRIYNTNITDLAPLRGMPLEHLHISGTKVKDLSVLRGMPLTYLRLHDCKEITDVSPLAESKALTEMTLPPNARDIQFLRSFANVQRLGLAEESKLWRPKMTAADFWKDYDDSDWSRALTAAGITHTAKREPDGTWAVTVTAKGFRDCSALKGLPISRLTLDSTSVVDLASLRGLQLKYLSLRLTRVADLSPLKGMPLENLALTRSNVIDLAPLRGLPLTKLYLGETAVRDLEPLRGMPLSTLLIYKTQVADLSPLKGMPLADVSLYGLEVSDLSVLAETKVLEQLALPATAKDLEFLRGFPKLKNLSFTVDTKAGYKPNKTADEFWKEWDGEAPVRKLRDAGIAVKSSKMFPDGTWDVNLDNASISDLAMLRGMKVSYLHLNSTAVTDLAPLRDLPIKYLNISNCAVSDLSPLKGMSIQTLVLRNTQVTDLSPLRDMPLNRLYLNFCRGLADVSPLKDCKELTEITLPEKATDIEFLRALSKLERISYSELGLNAGGGLLAESPDQTAAEFWKEFDGQLWLRKLRESGVAIKSAKQLTNDTWQLDLTEAKLTDLTLLKGAPISHLFLPKGDIADLSPLQGMPLTILKMDSTQVADLAPLKGMPLADLNITGTKVADLTPLRGAPLKVLQAGNTGITDLEPLRGMKLRNLRIFNNKITDLTPLKGMEIELLNLSGTKVSDLSVLRGMPLTSLRLHNCNELTDVSPLADAAKLQDLTLAPKAKDFEFLRKLTSLKSLSFTETTSGLRRPDKTAEEFWAAYDAKKK